MSGCVIDDGAAGEFLDADLESDLAGRIVYLVVMRVCSIRCC